jgi:1-acyl-sn-glycerol-3-phosphate acyltransferase
MAESLQAGDMVAVFPEGTTGLGLELLPFHANLLQAAISTRTPVQPLVLRYFDRKAPYSLAVTYIGETTLLQSLWRVACTPGLQVQIQVLPAMSTAHADRRALAAHLREVMGHSLQAGAADVASAPEGVAAAPAAD